MVSLLAYFGYELKQGGTGSGVKFIKEGSNEVINFHKPHPNGILKRYILQQVIEKLIDQLPKPEKNGKKREKHPET